MEILGGSHARMRATKKQIQQVVNGGRRADLIRKAANAHHSNIDIPDAEMFLDMALREESSHISNTISSEQGKEPVPSFWENAKRFWRSLFIK